jgi:hypothetical protein
MFDYASMVPVAPSQVTLFLFSPCTRDQITAASICCSTYEEEIIPSLCMERERADPKLTLSERARITYAFFLTWGIVLGSPFDSYQEQVVRLSPKDVLYVRELALFMHNVLDNWQHGEIARLMRYSEDGDIPERCIDLLELTTRYYEGCAGP